MSVVDFGLADKLACRRTSPSCELMLRDEGPPKPVVNEGDDGRITTPAVERACTAIRGDSGTPAGEPPAIMIEHAVAGASEVA